MKTKMLMVVLALVLIVVPVSARASQQLETEQVIANVLEALGEVQDIQGQLTITEVVGGRTTVTQLIILASLVEELARLEFSQPAPLRGQIIVADQQKQEVSMYMPIINQILVQSLADLGEEMGIGLDLLNLDMLLDLDQYSITVQEIVAFDGGLEYEIHAYDPVSKMELHVWVRDTDWMPNRMTFVAGPDQPGSMVLEDAVFNGGLGRGELLAMPDVPRIKM